MKLYTISESIFRSLNLARTWPSCLTYRGLQITLGMSYFSGMHDSALGCSSLRPVRRCSCFMAFKKVYRPDLRCLWVLRLLVAHEREPLHRCSTGRSPGASAMAIRLSGAERTLRCCPTNKQPLTPHHGFHDSTLRSTCIYRMAAAADDNLQALQPNFYWGMLPLLFG